MARRKMMGLDVSTTCIGMTIADVEDGKLSLDIITHIKPKVPKKITGTEAMFMKSKIFNETLVKYADYGITDVVIEEPLIGSNNAFTVSTLLKFNGMISQSVYDRLGVIPEFISSHDARMFADPSLMSIRKFNKKGDVYPASKIRSSIKKNELVLFGSYPFDCEKKLIMWNYVSDLFPNINWVFNKDGELKTENFDASDSMVCVLGYLTKEIYGGEEAKITSWTEKKTGEGIVFDYEIGFCGQVFHKKIMVEK